MISEQKVLEIQKKFPSHLWLKLKTYHTETYKYISENFEGDTFSEKAYQYVYGTGDRNCFLDECDNICGFGRFSNGFKKYCSYKCSGVAKENKVENTCRICGKVFITVESRSRNFCSEECRKKYMKTDEFKNKIIEGHKRYSQNEYGADFYFETDEFKKKARETKIDKYDDPNYVNVKKAKNTKKQKYGDANYNNLKKAIKTINQKYTSFAEEGVITNISQTLEYKNKLYGNHIDKIDKKLLDHIERGFSEDDYKGVVDDNGSVQYKFKCLKCQDTFFDHLNNGNTPICPNCDRIENGTSKYEVELYNFLDSILDCKIIRNDQSVLCGRKELDIYIPGKNAAIEFDGIYWHGELRGKGKEYHLSKTEECEEKNIQLIHLFENEWVFKKDKVKSRLKHILGVQDKQPIYARNCEVNEITTSQKNHFLDKHHLQGSGNSSVKLGIFNGERFVGVMTFGTPSVAQGHKNTDELVYEIKRFCVSGHVIGAAGKLFKYFIRNYEADKVITYADRRWSSNRNNVYGQIGFDLVKTTKPNYFYFRENLNLYHRFNFRKNVLKEKLEVFDMDLSEWENMKLNGYDRIWDCGHLKYLWEA